MNINLRNILLGERQARKPPALVAVTPHRTGERTLLGVENLLQSIAVPEPFSLELAGDMDGVSLLARCLDDRVVKQQLAAHYPQARIRDVAPEDDPMRRRQGELAWGLTLRVDGPEYVPLRTFRDDDLLDLGSDPLLAVIGSLSALRPGERVVARLLLRALGPEWAQAHQARAHQRAVPDNRDPSYTFHTRPLQVDGVTMAVLGVGALLALRGYLWVQDGEILKASLLGLGAVSGLIVAGWGWWRWKQARNRVYDPLLIREKVSRIAFDAELQVTAFLPYDTGNERALDLLSDWPWLQPAHLGQLMGVGRTRLYQVLERLRELELVVVADTEGQRCLALSDKGLAALARRDRTAVGLARQRWSAAPVKLEVPLTWRKRPRLPQPPVAAQPGPHPGRPLVPGDAGQPSPVSGLGSRPA